VQPQFNPWTHRRIELDEVQPRVGVRCQPLTVHYGFRPSPPQEKKPFGVVFFWRRPTSYSAAPWLKNFLRLQAWHGPKQEPFHGRDRLQEVFKGFGRPAPPYNQPTQDAHDFLVARVEGPTDILVQFTIDTEDDHFLQAAHQHLEAGDGLPFELKVGFRIFDAQQPDHAEDDGIVLALNSARLPKFDDGFVGIDLGHATTSLAWMASAGGSSRAIRTLHAKGVASPPDCKEPSYLGALQENAPPAESNLLLTHVNTEGHPEPHELGWARWAIGVQPDEKQTESLFVSVKRMLAERRLAARPRRVVAYTKVAPAPADQRVEQEVAPHLPAELFFCRLFQRFREATRSDVRQFAVTYPTTFSRRELDQVREAAWHGWQRATEELAETPAPLEFNDLVTRHFPLALDEASAAGFFFLHRKVFERPHGLAAFRYLYRDGFNLLLFDCGGGTIDIGLLRAEVFDKPARVRISVVGRSGKRAFGGDNVTEAVFRLLKAQVAATLSQTGGAGVARLQPPVQAEEWPAWLQQNADAINQLLPTRFNPDHLQDETARRRRRLTQDLWATAERMKVRLGTEGAVSFVLAGNSPLDEHLSRTLSPQQKMQIEGRLRSIQVQRAQVDALVGHEVRDSIDRCNHLIADKLTRDGQEVHCVVAAGNGTRYPLFKEEMERHLAVPFLDERLEPFPAEEQANLKDAVAKGAVLALASRQQAGNVQVEFDETLCDRIPFDLAYRDRYHGQLIPLLHEHQPYNDLANGSEPLDVSLRDEADNVVLLYRRWPGEAAFWPYLVYRFDHPARDAVTVRYDAAERRFEVRSGSQPAELVMEIVEDMDEDRLMQTLASGSLGQAARAIYYSPVQRGTL
jgi:molecular chaperone DnaK (HSP70)